MLSLGWCRFANSPYYPYCTPLGRFPRVSGIFFNGRKTLVKVRAMEEMAFVKPDAAASAAILKHVKDLTIAEMKGCISWLVCVNCLCMSPALKAYGDR